ncbi:hypothetical protein KC350_g86 [Hortaea werneckii]|nr:hypothetical protein KC350_g86 [Hortaea werneckii]
MPSSRSERPEEEASRGTGCLMSSPARPAGSSELAATSAPSVLVDLLGGSLPPSLLPSRLATLSFSLLILAYDLDSINRLSSSSRGSHVNPCRSSTYCGLNPCSRIRNPSRALAQLPVARSAFRRTTSRHRNVEHGHGNQSAVETVAVVPAAQGFAAVAVVPMQWGGAEEAFEACFADVVIAFMVDVPLVVIEQGEFFFSKVVWFQGYGEDVLGGNVRFDGGCLGLVDASAKIFRVGFLDILLSQHVSIPSSAAGSLIV